MRPLVLATLAALALAVSPAVAQTSVSGVVTDSSGTTLPAATVALLQRADSSIVSFTTTRADGAFAMPRVDRGAYLVQVSFVGFVPATAPVDVGSEPVDLGRIRLAANTESLGTLVVTADRVPVVVRRDTLDFDANAFATPPGATVEDLLRRMPGVEVQRDGSIRAQGQTVDRVLVDGREFFGDDPTMATRNLPADAVDRVQIYDRASETADFTGVADGNEERTIDLKLRPDRRTGQFGSAGGAGGAGGGAASVARFDGKASINRFSPTSQVSVLGNVNNVNRQAFGLDDMISFLGGLSTLSAGGRLEVPDGVPFGDDASDGFATTVSGGVNLNRDLGAATTLESSAFGSRVWTERDREIQRVDLLGAGQRSETQETADQTGHTDAHRLDLSVLHALSETHDVRLRGSARVLSTSLDASGLRRTTGPTGVVEAGRTTSRETDARTLGGDASVTYRRRLGARSLVARARGGVENGLENRAFSASDPDGDGAERIDQTQTVGNRTIEGGASLLLTQPLGPRRALQVEAEHRAVGERRDRTLLDRADGDTVPTVLPLDRTTQVSSASLTVRDNGPSHTASAGLSLETTRLDGATDLVVPRRRPLRVLPAASLTLTLPRDRQLSFRYQAASAEPGLRQLQPVADVRGALDVFVGNPALEPETTHTATARYIHFDSFALSSLSAFVTSTVTTNAITTARTIGSDLRRTSTPINAGTAWRLDTNASYNTPIRRLRTKVSVSGSGSHSRRSERIDGLDNTAAVSHVALDVSVENQRKVRVDVRAGARVSLTDARYSLSPAFDRTYLSRAVYAQASAELGRSWVASSTFDHEVFPGGVFGAAQRLPQWSAELSRAVGARTRIQLSAYDLLDQGLAVSYDAAPTAVQEERIRSLGRHVLLRLVVDLSPTRR